MTLVEIAVILGVAFLGFAGSAAVGAWINSRSQIRIADNQKRRDHQREVREAVAATIVAYQVWLIAVVGRISHLKGSRTGVEPTEIYESFRNADSQFHKALVNAILLADDPKMYAALDTALKKWKSLREASHAYMKSSKKCAEQTWSDEHEALEASVDALEKSTREWLASQETKGAVASRMRKWLPGRKRIENSTRKKVDDR